MTKFGVPKSSIISIWYIGDIKHAHNKNEGEKAEVVATICLHKCGYQGSVEESNKSKPDSFTNIYLMFDFFFSLKKKGIKWIIYIYIYNSEIFLSLINKSSTQLYMTKLNLP